MPVPRVLIVEDDPDIARLLMMDLRDHGFAAQRAGSVMEGLIQARETAPELILLDLGSPDGDGGDVVTRMRANTRVATRAATSPPGPQEA